MSTIQITNVRAEFSEEHARESLLFELAGTEYRELVTVWETGSELPEIRCVDDEYIAGHTSQLADDFGSDTITEIHDQLSAWIEKSDGVYTPASDEPRVAEIWHQIFKSNGMSITLPEDAYKELDVADSGIDIEFNDGYTVLGQRDSTGTGEFIEFYPGPPDDRAAQVRGYLGNFALGLRGYLPGHGPETPAIVFACILQRSAHQFGWRLSAGAHQEGKGRGVFTWPDAHGGVQG